MKTQSKLIPKKELKLKTFLFALISSMVLFLPFVMMQGGTFTYYGDFNIQTVPFNILNNNLIKSGETGWCWFNGLGSDFLTSFSYYTLGSPFFYLMALFPSSFVPYLLAPIICLKIALMALTSYIYIRQYVDNPSSAMIGGLLYAFSGWTMYNMFFFVFLDAAVFFPLILWALDNLIEHNKKYYLAIIVSLIAIDNFYFFIEIGIFTFIYFVVRTITKSWNMNFKKFLNIFLEVLIGIVISSFILIPSIVAVLKMPRSTVTLSGLSLFFLPEPEDYLKIVAGFFLPSQTPGVDLLFGDEFNLTWSSISFYLPFVSMIGVIAWCRENKKHWMTILIVLSAIFLFIPVLNNIFNMENIQIYMRWTFMLVLFLSLATVKAIENMKFSFKSNTLLTIAITLITVVIAVCFITENSVLKTSEGYFLYGSLVVVLLSLLIFSLIIRQRRVDYKKFVKNLTYCILLFSVISGWIMMALGICTVPEYSTHPKNVYLESKLELPGNKDQYRISSEVGYENFNMIDKYQGTETFQTFVSPSSIEFYEYLGYKVGAGFSFGTNNSVMTFLSNKYYITNSMGYDLNIYKEKKKDLSLASPVNKKGELTLSGYKKIDKNKNLNIYENENYIPYGFTYDSYYLESDTSKLTKEEKSTLLLKGVLLNDKQANKYKNILKKYKVEQDNLSYDEKEYEKDCKNIKKRTLAQNFKITKDGFRCDFQDAKKENLVFFSIPYDTGWTAYIDGEKVEIENVNKGFMALDVLSGKHKIEFKYKNNIAAYSKYVSLIGIAIFGLYISFNIYKRRKIYD